MAGDVKTEHRVFAGKTLFLTPRGSFAQFEWHGCGSGSGSEQSVLAGFARPGSTLQSGHGIVHGCEHGFARTERIHGTRLDETFKNTLIEKARFDALAAVVE